MRIYYDGKIYSMYRHRPGGISNFFDHLISRISSYHECLLTSSRPCSLPHPSGKNLSIARFGLSCKSERLRRKLERIYFSCRSTSFRPNIIHSTYYGRPAIFTRNAPIIFTAYDMIHEKWSKDLDPRGHAKHEKYLSFETAAAIPCISKSTCQDILDLYPHLEHKVSVIYLAGDLKSTPINESLSPSFSDASYLLYVGARDSYKNFFRLVEAFAFVANRFPRLRLKVVGAPFRREEIERLEVMKVLHRIDMHANLADEELYRLYQGALAFVYPSLYEGFGIPPLEAMALNTPVLASNTSSIPEATGDAALLFNPWSVESIRDAILHVAYNPSLRQDLIQKGKIQCKKFSWEKTASDYLQLYEKVAKKYVF